MNFTKYNNFIEYVNDINENEEENTTTKQPNIMITPPNESIIPIKPISVKPLTYEDYMNLNFPKFNMFSVYPLDVADVSFKKYREHWCICKRNKIVVTDAQLPKYYFISFYMKNVENNYRIRDHDGLDAFYPSTFRYNKLIDRHSMSVTLTTEKTIVIVAVLFNDSGHAFASAESRPFLVTSKFLVEK